MRRVFMRLKTNPLASLARSRTFALGMLVFILLSCWCNLLMVGAADDGLVVCEKNEIEGQQVDDCHCADVAIVQNGFECCAAGDKGCVCMEKDTKQQMVNGLCRFCPPGCKFEQTNDGGLFQQTCKMDNKTCPCKSGESFEAPGYCIKGSKKTRVLCDLGEAQIDDLCCPTDASSKSECTCFKDHENKPLDGSCDYLDLIHCDLVETKVDSVSGQYEDCDCNSRWDISGKKKDRCSSGLYPFPTVCKEYKKMRLEKSFLTQSCQFCPPGHSFVYEDDICTCNASQGANCLGCEPGEILNENGFCQPATDAKEQSSKRAICPPGSYKIADACCPNDAKSFSACKCYHNESLTPDELGTCSYPYEPTHPEPMPIPDPDPMPEPDPMPHPDDPVPRPDPSHHKPLDLYPMPIPDPVPRPRPFKSCPKGQYIDVSNEPRSLALNKYKYQPFSQTNSERLKYYKAFNISCHKCKAGYTTKDVDYELGEFNLGKGSCHMKGWLIAVIVISVLVALCIIIAVVYKVAFD